MLRDVLFKGGYVMIPLLLCSVTALAVSIERFLFFARIRRVHSGLHERIHAVRKLVAAGVTGDAGSLLNEADSPITRVLHTGLQARNPEAADREMQVAASLERRRLFAGLPVLDTIVTAAPLLGLLGTVTGILNTFQRMGAEPAVRNMQVIGKGIAEALITTATGLIVAIPALVLLNYFAHRAEMVNEAIEREMTDFTGILIGRGE